MRLGVQERRLEPVHGQDNLETLKLNAEIKHVRVWVQMQEILLDAEKKRRPQKQTKNTD